MKTTEADKALDEAITEAVRVCDETIAAADKVLKEAKTKADRICFEAIKASEKTIAEAKRVYCEATAEKKEITT